MLLGVHVSIAGGYENAFIEAKRLGINCFQIFTKNQRQWKEKILTEEEKMLFRKNLKDYNIKAVFSHTSYLINLGSSNDMLRESSILSLAAELQRCEDLGLKFCVQHPGSSKGSTEKEAIKKISSALKLIFKNSKGDKAKILLENTAGQGNSIGWSFEQIATIIDQTASDRVGMCFDTCHAFAAGHDIRTATGFEDVMSTIDKLIGIKKLEAFHLNDSKGDLGSRIDRHAHIGEGRIGIEAFRQVINKFPEIPKALETPKENDADVKNLTLLRNLAEN